MDGKSGDIAGPLVQGYRRQGEKPPEGIAQHSLHQDFQLHWYRFDSEKMGLPSDWQCGELEGPLPVMPYIPLTKPLFTGGLLRLPASPGPWPGSEKWR